LIPAAESSIDVGSRFDFFAARISCRSSLGFGHVNRGVSDLFQLVLELQKFLIIFVGEVKENAAFPCFEFGFWALEEIFCDCVHIWLERKERCPFCVAHCDIVNGEQVVVQESLPQR